MAGARGWLAAVVGLSFAILAVQGLAVTHPTVFADELVYSTAAEGLAERGSPGAGYGYGLAYPLLLAPAYAVLGGDDAYTVAKIVNAALFSLTAIPAYLLARRVARPGLAVAAAALAVILPTRVLATFVLTESLAYLLFGIALVAAARMLERPTVSRQLVVLGVIALGAQSRRQLLVLALVVPLAILVDALVTRGRTPLGRTLARYAVTWTALGIAGLTAVAVAVAGGGASRLLGPYDVLVRGYSATDTAAWLGVHAAALVVLTAFVPALALAVALPPTLRADAPPGARSIGVLTVVAVPLVLVQVAAFTGTAFGLGLVHERNLFYVAPLLFALLAGWVDQGAPRPGPLFAVAAVAVVLAPLALVLRDATSTAVDAPTLFVLRYGTRGAPAVPVGVLLVAVVAVTVASILARSRPVAALVVTGTLLATCAAVVQVPVARSAAALEERVARGVDDRPRTWADDALGRSAQAVLLTVTPERSCPSGAADRRFDQERVWSTVFFNRVLVEQVAIGGHPVETALPLREATVATDGRILVAGEALHEPLVVADNRLVLGGQRLHEDPATGLLAWAASTPLRVTGDPRALVCGAGSG